MRLKQASHWHDKRFTPWHAIWRDSEGRIGDSVRGMRGDVGHACHVLAKILKCSKKIFQGVTILVTTKLLSAHA